MLSQYILYFVWIVEYKIKPSHIKLEKCTCLKLSPCPFKSAAAVIWLDTHSQAFKMEINQILCTCTLHTWRQIHVFCSEMSIHKVWIESIYGTADMKTCIISGVHMFQLIAIQLYTLLNLEVKHIAVLHIRITGSSLLVPWWSFLIFLGGESVCSPENPAYSVEF